MLTKTPDEIGTLGELCSFVTSAAEEGFARRAGQRCCVRCTARSSFPIRRCRTASVKVAVRKGGFIGEARLGPGDPGRGEQAVASLRVGSLASDVAASLPPGVEVVGIGWGYEAPLMRDGWATPEDLVLQSRCGIGRSVGQLRGHRGTRRRGCPLPRTLTEGGGTMIELDEPELLAPRLSRVTQAADMLGVDSWLLTTSHAVRTVTGAWSDDVDLFGEWSSPIVAVGSTVLSPGRPPSDARLIDQVIDLLPARGTIAVDRLGPLALERLAELRPRPRRAGRGDAPRCGQGPACPDRDRRPGRGASTYRGGAALHGRPRRPGSLRARPHLGIHGAGGRERP